MQIRKLVKKSGGVLLIALLSDIAAFKFWHDFITTGQIHDGRNYANFSGEAATGHLLAFSLLALITSYYAGRDIYYHIKENL